jgi:hypothetical protein
MSEHKAKKVSVTALKFHTLDGTDHAEGDTYDVDADQVENLVAQGMAKPSAEVEADEAHAKADAKADAKKHK